MSVKQKNNAEIQEEQLGKQEIDPNEEDFKEAESGPDRQSDSETDVDELIGQQQAKIQELEEELRTVRENQLRKAAEMENMRKRLQREREQIYRTARENAVREFLPVSDDLLRTLEAMEKDDEGSAYIDGVKMVADKFDDVLEKYGVVRIDETGVPFDVDLHDALLRQKPDDDSIESGTVLKVIENGYKMGDKTLRHAKVIVSE